MILGALIPDGDTESDGNEAVEVQKVAKQAEPEAEAGGESSHTPENEAKHPDDQIAEEISDDSMGEERNSEDTEERPEQEIAKPDSKEPSVAEKSVEIAPKSVRTPKFDPAIKGNVTLKSISIGKVEARYKESMPAYELYLLVKENPDARIFGVKSQATVGIEFTDYIKLIYDRELHILCHLRRTAYSPRIGLKDEYRWVVWKNVTPEHFKTAIPFLDETLPQLLSETKNHKQFPIRYTHNGAITNWP